MYIIDGASTNAIGSSSITTSTTSKTVEASTHATLSTSHSQSHNDAPPPTKKQRVAISSDNITSTYSELKDGVAELHSILNEINPDDLEIEKRMDKVFANIAQLKQNNRRMKYKDVNNKEVSLLLVPVATTDKSYQLSNDWLLQALDINGQEVEMQRCHGGSLTGKDILKVVANANHIFDEFAKIFIEHKRKDCVLTDDEIRQLCEDHKRALLLWDDAYSHPRTVDSTPHDFAMYQSISTELYTTTSKSAAQSPQRST